jgi:ribonucleotide reductase beta subunit family protein with ferritin-like domain
MGKGFGNRKQMALSRESLQMDSLLREMWTIMTAPSLVELWSIVKNMEKIASSSLQMVINSLVSLKMTSSKMELSNRQVA